MVGMGTSRLTCSEKEAVEVLKHGIDLGMTLIDTAEAYGDGRCEEIVSEAIRDRRDEVFIATKASLEHFAFRELLRELLKSAERSLRRLNTSYIDLYQLHAPNPHISIKETMRAMEKLVTDGRVRFIGVSNFSVEQIIDANEALSRSEIVSNQVAYSLLNRKVEGQLIPFCNREGMTMIAYSPLARGRIPHGGSGKAWLTLDEVALTYHKSRAQVALNWLIKKQNVVAIPKASSIGHV